MAVSGKSLYMIKFPEAFRSMDPEFTDRWMLPCYCHPSRFLLPSGMDLSDLARTPLTDRETLVRLYPGFFRNPALPDPVCPLPPEEEEALLARSASEGRDRIFAAHMDTALSAAHDYASGEDSFCRLALVALEALVAAVDSCPADRRRCFRVFSLWQIRIAILRSLWDDHPENPRRHSGLLIPEYRLRNPDVIFGTVSPADAGAGILSLAPIAQRYRDLVQEPEDFSAVMEKFSGQEAEVLDLVLRENCLLTLYDAADRFGVSPQRILQILNKFHRRTRSTRNRKDLEAFLR